MYLFTLSVVIAMTLLENPSKPIFRSIVRVGVSFLARQMQRQAPVLHFCPRMSRFVFHETESNKTIHQCQEKIFLKI